jgi:archaellum component FlaC
VEVKDRTDEPIDLNGTDIYKINLVLKFTFIMLNNEKLEIFHNILKSNINPFALMFGREALKADMEEKQKFMDDFVKQTRKYKNYKDFFGNEIKMLNFAGDKTIKKLSKLYDMVDSNKDSIVNWELHHKINKTAEKTKERLNELLSDTPPVIYKKKD